MNKDKISIIDGLPAAPKEFSNSQQRIINFFFRATIVGVLAAMLGIILYYVYAFASLANGSHSFDWLLSIFSDFVTIMHSSLLESPYTTGGASYPPLAIAILYPFALICKGVFAQYDDPTLTVDELTSKVVRHAEFWVAIVLFFTICTALIVFTIIKTYRLDLNNAIKVSSIILFSSPFVYAIMRGNTIYFALVFLLFFLMLYRSPNAILREVAILCLAFAGLIKIYPLFFGVFLLRDKKIFASIRVAVYFLVGSFLSFFIYSAGLNDLSFFVNNLGSFATDSFHLLANTNLSLTSSICKIFEFIVPTSSSGTFFSIFNISLTVIIFAVATLHSKAITFVHFV